MTTFKHTYNVYTFGQVGDTQSARMVLWTETISPPSPSWTTCYLELVVTGRLDTECLKPRAGIGWKKLYKNFSKHMIGSLRTWYPSFLRPPFYTQSLMSSDWRYINIIELMQGKEYSQSLNDFIAECKRCPLMLYRNVRATWRGVLISSCARSWGG